MSDILQYVDRWTAWLLSLDWYHFLSLTWPVLLLDTPRYVLSKVIMLAVDLVRGRHRQPVTYHHCPSVTVVLAGHNEAHSIGKTIESVLGTYPKLDIVVVDDGSTDGMAEAVLPYLKESNVCLYVHHERAGKSSSVNQALAESNSEIILVIDADSSIEANTIWEIVQPFADPEVGVVGGTLRVRNASCNLLTRLQAYEYLHTIFMGRQVQSSWGILACASGALGAFRRDAALRAGGWDVGPGEDGDITIKIRKLGYRAVFAPYANCYTDVPETWMGVWRQRRRWGRGVIRYKCRKHIDMANPRAAHFCWSNFLLLANVWIFQIGVLLSFWAVVAWMVFSRPEGLAERLILTYACYLILNMIQVVTILHYSDRPTEDGLNCLALPFNPIYGFWTRLVRLVAIVEEVFSRASFRDNYVPARVRAVTIQW